MVEETESEELKKKDEETDDETNQPPVEDWQREFDQEHEELAEYFDIANWTFRDIQDIIKGFRYIHNLELGADQIIELLATEKDYLAELYDEYVVGIETTKEILNNNMEMALKSGFL